MQSKYVTYQCQRPSRLKSPELNRLILATEIRCVFVRYKMHLFTYCVHEVHARPCRRPSGWRFRFIFLAERPYVLADAQIPRYLSCGRPSVNNNNNNNNSNSKAILFYDDEPSRSSFFCAFCVTLNLQSTQFSVRLHGVCHVQAWAHNILCNVY
jgi:hypothetical protein